MSFVLGSHWYVLAAVRSFPHRGVRRLQGATHLAEVEGDQLKRL